MRTMKHFALATMAAAALALAGCGGGGSGTSRIAPPPTTMPDPPPAPAPVADVMIPDAMYLDEENAPMAGSMTIAAGDSYTNNGVMFSCPADGDACEVEVMDDGTVTSTGGEATPILTSDAMMQVAQAKKEAADKMAADALENRDRIIGKDRALEAAANLPATTTGGIVGEAAIIITRGGSGPAKVTSAGYSAADDPALPNEDVWIGSHLTQAVTGVGTNHLFVYTDKEPATRIQFYNWDGDATTPSLYADTITDDLMQPADSNTVITPLDLDGTIAPFSASVTDPTRFPQPQSAEEGSRRQNYPNNDDTDGDLANGLEQVSIPGNYNGAGGRYVCTGGTAAAPCSVTVTPAGTYTGIVGTWTFVPELNSTAWIQDGGTAAGAGGGQQGEFMSFGWWLQEPTVQTGAYTFRYYADGTAYNLSTGNLARGSATYNGRAAGKFVVQEIDETGVTGGEAGMFTAAATLTAMFNNTGAGGTLQGAINGFQSDNAGVDVSGWSVTLARQTLTDTSGTRVTSTGTNNDSTSAGFDGATAMMGDQTAHGTWDSQFFGQPATADAYPLGVGGTFQADNEAASIAGAFGARR